MTCLFQKANVKYFAHVSEDLVHYLPISSKSGLDNSLAVKCSHDTRQSGGSFPRASDRTLLKQGYLSSPGEKQHVSKLLFYMICVRYPKNTLT